MNGELHLEDTPPTLMRREMKWPGQPPNRPQGGEGIPWVTPKTDPATDPLRRPAKSTFVGKIVTERAVY